MQAINSDGELIIQNAVLQRISSLIRVIELIQQSIDDINNNEINLAKHKVSSVYQLLDKTGGFFVIVVTGLKALVMNEWSDLFYHNLLDQTAEVVYKIFSDLFKLDTEITVCFNVVNYRDFQLYRIKKILLEALFILALITSEATEEEISELWKPQLGEFRKIKTNCLRYKVH